MKKVKVPVEIRFKDVDLAGHVHHSIYLIFFEQARLNYFAEFVPSDHDWNAQGLVVARVEVDHLDRLALNDKVVVELWCERIGNKSFDLVYEVIKNGESICCTGKTTMVCFDFNENATIGVPQEWRKALIP